ncbi:unnamed protein product [Larinioides sclopetarius]|uniref:Ribosomal protein S15 n=1 Tax=Larinioides sclopetarius TaxID=280406 RepID=A0AAV1ZX55_9ARAC
MKCLEVDIPILKRVKKKYQDRKHEFHGSKKEKAKFSVF